MVDATGRLNEDYNGQEFVLIITIKDPNKNDIYSEISNTLIDRGYSFENLKLKNQIRQVTKIIN